MTYHVTVPVQDECVFFFLYVVESYEIDALGDGKMSHEARKSHRKNPERPEHPKWTRIGKTESKEMYRALIPDKISWKVTICKTNQCLAVVYM